MELHGGNIYKLARENGKTGLLDYSANINPFGVPESLKKAICENIGVVESYPDPDYVELREAIAQYNNVNMEEIIVGNGATELIFLYMKAIAPKKVLIAAPTFAEYERAAKMTGAEVDFFELREDEGFKLNIDSLKETLKKKYDIFVICNPNNPTGRFISAGEVLDINELCINAGTSLLIDEAFIDFVGLKKSIVSISKSRNIFVVRAMTKFFAVPGIRLGYAVSFNNEINSKILDFKEPWSVNGFAELAGKTVLKDMGYIEKSMGWISVEKEWFYNRLSTISGIKVYKTEANFILAKSLKKNAAKLREEMIEKGVVIRNASNFKFLDESFFRLAVKSREDNLRVIEVLREAVKI